MNASAVKTHYEQHLGPVYVWMAGGFDAALARGASELDALGIDTGTITAAIDLGAGFGMHALPLAERGARVIAIDTCKELLDELRTAGTARAIECIEDDLLGFRRHVPTPCDLILCMGDTLTHLPDHDAVRTLAREACAALAPPGRLILTFRDYTRELTGTSRFIPVRSDADRIFTCFLEYGPDLVTVTDLVHERTDRHWTLRAGSYPKLRLDPEWVIRALEEVGFVVARDAGPGGMVRLAARKQSRT
jgi:SAM-dependent methyltransferase